jgi:hypothetical protein
MHGKSFLCPVLDIVNVKVGGTYTNHYDLQI